MAVQIVGEQVSWGIPAAGQTIAGVPVEGIAQVEGIVQDFEMSRDGNVVEIADEDGDLVARVDHGAKNTITFSSIVVGTPSIPTKGTEVTFAADIDGFVLTTGEGYIESASISYAGTSTTSVSFTVTHYPSLTTA